MAVVVIVALTIGTLLWWGPAATEAYREHREERWFPGSWALTVDDFPAGTAQEIPVREEWLEHSAPLDPTSERIPVPNRVPGLELTSARYADEGALASAWNMAAYRESATLSGVRLGELEVYSAPIHSEILTDFDDLGATLQERALTRSQSVTSVSFAGAWPELLLDASPVLVDAVPLGDRITAAPTDFGTIDVIFEGDHGWVGISGWTAGTRTDDARQVAAVVAPTEGNLVLLGLTAPLNATVDWEEEIDPLLALIEAKMIAAPYDGDGG